MAVFPLGNDFPAMRGALCRIGASVLMVVIFAGVTAFRRVEAVSAEKGLDFNSVQM